MSLEEDLLGRNILFSCFSDKKGVAISQEKESICFASNREKGPETKAIRVSHQDFVSFLGDFRQNSKLLAIHLEERDDFQQTFGAIRFLRRRQKYFIAERGIPGIVSPSEIPVNQHVLLHLKKEIEEGRLQSVTPA